MPIASPRYRFRKQVIEGAPAEPGVYVLYEHDELIYIGLVELPSGIQTRLLEHYFGVREPSSATHYGWEICRDPPIRQAELMREFQAAHLRRPRYNGGPPGTRNTSG